MPVAWVNPGSQERFVILCQKADSLVGRCQEKVPDVRVLVSLMSGKFTLQEANDFMVECLDSNPIPDSHQFFDEPVNVYTLGFTGPTVPLRMAHILETYSVLEPVDEYTFHLVKHEVDFYCNELRRAEGNDIRRLKKNRRDRIRLGFPPLPGSSSDEIRESRPVRHLSFSTDNIAEGHEPYPHEM